MADGNPLFSSLKKLIFKDSPETEAGPSQMVPPPPAPPQKPALPDTPVPPYPAPAPSAHPPVSGETDETTRAKAYQLLESVNQPGVDFLEVWNAASENGGPAGVRAAFNALKFADKSLTREKVVSTGRYYIDALQKALQSDLAKKEAQQRALETEKTSRRQSLSNEIAAIEKQITDLQAQLVQKRNALTELDDRYEPQLAELQQKMVSGKSTIEAMLAQMHAILQAAEREL